MSEGNVVSKQKTIQELVRVLTYHDGDPALLVRKFIEIVNNAIEAMEARDFPAAFEIAFTWWATLGLVLELGVDSWKGRITGLPTLNLKAESITYRAHNAAVKLLMCECERRGIDSANIAISAQYCVEMLENRDMMIDYMEWPNFIMPTLFNLPPDVRIAIMAGDGAVRRLEAILINEGSSSRESLESTRAAVDEIRTEYPTEADLLVGRQILAEVVNPSVEGFRNAMRQKGLKGRNSKFKKVFDLLMEEKKK